MSGLRGVVSVLPTPFHVDGAVDYDSLSRIIDLYVGAEVGGLTALGVTSETAQLLESEWHAVLDTIMARVAGRVPVVVGTTREGTDACIQASRVAKQMGAAAVMVSPPRMPKLNSDAVMRHFSGLAESVDLPIVVQDYPPIAGYAMEPWLLVRIAREIPAARTIKLEDPPTPLKTSRILEVGGDLDIEIFGGLGGGFLLEELLAGATGAMTGFAYPEILVRVVSLYQSGEVDAAADLFYRCVPLMRFEFQAGVGMAIRKEMLRRRGVMSHGLVRAPGSNLDRSTNTALDRLLRWMAGQEGVEWISV